MQKGLLKYLFTALLFFIAASSVGQIQQYDPITGETISAIGSVTDYRTEEEKLADEQKNSRGDTTEVKERKPLESFYFNDSLRMVKIFAWKVNTKFNTISLTPVDTLLNGSFQTDYPFMAIDGGIGSAYLGNVGSATTPLSYASRVTPRNFSFVDVWRTYQKYPEEVLFYNSKTAYSRLTYEMSGETSIEENLFNVVLSHNISPSTSANITYTGDGTKGMYMQQSTTVWNLAISLAHTGKKFAIHGGYLYNGGDITENGGIQDDKMITDTVISQANMIDVNLSDAQNSYRGHTIWWTASYGIPLRAMKEDELTIEAIPSIYIGNSVNYTLMSKTYTDTEASSFYSNSYLDPDITYDSISQQVLDTRFFVQLQPYNRNGALGLISAGIGNEFSAYYLNVPGQYRDEWGGGRTNENTIYAYGDIDGRISKYVNWDANARLNLLGYRIGDFDINGNLKFTAYTKNKQQPISLDVSVKFSLTEPDFWAQSYFSNHFRWNNDFQKETKTELSARFSVEPINLYLGANYSITQNKVYYDSVSLPAQYTGSLSVLGVYAQKDFRAGGFNFNHRVLFQLSSQQEVAPVPTLSAYISYYYKFNVVKDILNMEIGLDGRYQTLYKGFGYNPAIAQFYNQQEVEVGGYPYLDAFVSAKWKRMRILVKLQNFNANLFGGRNYFMVAHYPQNRMMLKFRFSWSFYD